MFTTEVHEWSHADDGDFVLREPLLSLNVTIIAIIRSLTKHISSATNFQVQKHYLCPTADFGFVIQVVNTGAILMTPLMLVALTRNLFSCPSTPSHIRKEKYQ